MNPTMNLLRRFATILCTLAATLANADEKTANKSDESAKKSREGVLPYFETAEQIKAMKPCEAAVEEINGCYAVFRAADGKEFTIGFPGNTHEVQGFLNTLKKGQTYKFPSAFLSYQKKP
jgi:hypothetical protein